MVVQRRQPAAAAAGSSSSADKQDTAASHAGTDGVDTTASQPAHGGKTSSNGAATAASASSSGATTTKSARLLVPRHEPTPYWVYLLLTAIAGITVVTRPEPFQPPHGSEPTLRHVFFYGWLTALSTGLGAVPFFFLPRVSTFFVGISNGTMPWARSLSAERLSLLCESFSSSRSLTDGRHVVVGSTVVSNFSLSLSVVLSFSTSS